MLRIDSFISNIIFLFSLQLLVFTSLSNTDSQFVTYHLYKSVVKETCLWGNIFNMSDMIIISIEIICYILLSSLIRAHDACFNRADFKSFTIQTSSMNISSTTSLRISNLPTHFFSARKRHLNGKYTLHILLRELYPRYFDIYKRNNS